MKCPCNHIKRVLEYYISLLNKLESNVKHEIEGRLEVYKKYNGHEYYHVYKNFGSGEVERRYIKEEEILIAKRLAQQSYERKLVKLLKRTIEKIQFISSIDDIELENIYNNYSEGRKILLDPLVKSRAEIIDDWKAFKSKQKPFRENSFIITTNKGERVRSKSEKILADFFDSIGSYYIYEMPLTLRDGTKIYPDFTFLQADTNEKIYWEHFGMIDDPNYANNMLLKLSQYLKNDIILGKNLVISLESSTKPLDMTWVDRMVRELSLS